MQPSTRDERLALNESRFRDINERLRRDLSPLRHLPAQIDFVCECGRLDCRDRIAVTAEEYERVRQDAMLFVIACGHEFPEVEDVVEANERFAIVRKHPSAEHVARATDPRRDA